MKNGGFYVQKPLASVRYLHFVSRTHPLVLLTDRGKATFYISTLWVKRSDLFVIANF